MEWITNVLSGLLILLIGIYLIISKNPSIVAGYNETSEFEKAKLNWDKICNFLGSMLILSGLILLIGAFLIIKGIDYNRVLPISWGLFFIIIQGGVVYINKSKRFKK